MEAFIRSNKAVWLMLVADFLAVLGWFSAPALVFVLIKRWHVVLPILFALTIELTVLYFTLKPLL